jgi:Xaa-Pro aminopeptidase
MLTTDPSLDLIAGTYCAWQSAFLVAANGERIAVVGRHDAPNVRDLGAYSEVVAYDEEFDPQLRAAIERLDPASIAVNYSTSDAAADGLTHGMWLVLEETLAGTPYADRLVSSETVVNALRGRKSQEEVRRIRAAIGVTEDIFDRVTAELRPGLSELEIAAVVHEEVAKRGLGYAWEVSHCPAVNAGPEKEIGHSSPGELRIARGQLLHIDFGVTRDEYTSDLQRVWYFLDEGGTAPPPDVTSAWDALWAALASASRHSGRVRLGGRWTRPPARHWSRPATPSRSTPSVTSSDARRTTEAPCSGRAGNATGAHRSVSSKRGTSTRSSSGPPFPAAATSASRRTWS